MEKIETVRKLKQYLNKFSDETKVNRIVMNNGNGSPVNYM